MKAKTFTLLDVQKAIVLAQRAGTVTSDSQVVFSKIVRSNILQQVTNVFIEKYGDSPVSEDNATRAIKEGVKRFVNSCGVSDKTYINSLVDVFSTQLKQDIIEYASYV